MTKPCDSATAARRLLAAIQGGNLARLAAELDRTRPAPADLPAGTRERWELLDAITGDMRRALRRLRLHATADFAGRHVHLRLLRHLAELSPAV